MRNVGQYCVYVEFNVCHDWFYTFNSFKSPGVSNHLFVSSRRHIHRWRFFSTFGIFDSRLSYDTDRTIGVNRNEWIWNNGPVNEGEEDREGGGGVVDDTLVNTPLLFFLIPSQFLFAHLPNSKRKIVLSLSTFTILKPRTKEHHINQYILLWFPTRLA